MLLEHKRVGVAPDEVFTTLVKFCYFQIEESVKSLRELAKVAAVKYSVGQRDQIPDSLQEEIQKDEESITGLEYYQFIMVQTVRPCSLAEYLVVFLPALSMWYGTTHQSPASQP